MAWYTPSAPEPEHHLALTRLNLVTLHHRDMSKHLHSIIYNLSVKMLETFQTQKAYRFIAGEKKKKKKPSWIIKKEPWTVWRSTNKRTPHTNWSEKGGGWGREALQQGSHFHVQPPSLTLLNDLELPWASGVTTGHSSLLEEEKQRRQTGSCSSRSLMYISSSP